MDDTIKIALAGFFEKQKKAAEPLDPGIHPIDTTIVLKIKGNVNKLADVLYTPTVDIPLLATMALLLEKMGFQRERAGQLLEDSMREALILDEKAAPHVADRVRDIETAMERVRAITDELPKKTRSGATKVEIVVNQLELQPA